jgi:DNA-3-methyladenine glycosylase I
MVTRCSWCSTDPIYQEYHDLEWGQPLHQEHLLFEMLCLEGQQAGLSWLTVLKKRRHYRAHFFQYPISDIAQISDAELELKLQDDGLIRHLGKLSAIRDNAIAWQVMKKKGFSLPKWLWQFSGEQPVCNRVNQDCPVASQTQASIAMSKALKQHGFKFVGPTICYAFMQAVGMVNDHDDTCHFKYKHGKNLAN